MDKHDPLVISQTLRVVSEEADMTAEYNQQLEDGGEWGEVRGGRGEGGEGEGRWGT